MNHCSSLDYGAKWNKENITGIQLRYVSSLLPHPKQFDYVIRLHFFKIRWCHTRNPLSLCPLRCLLWQQKTAEKKESHNELWSCVFDCSSFEERWSVQAYLNCIEREMDWKENIKNTLANELILIHGNKLVYNETFFPLRLRFEHFHLNGKTIYYKRVAADFFRISPYTI